MAEKYELDAREADLRTRLIAAGCEVPESGSPEETEAYINTWNKYYNWSSSSSLDWPPVV